MKKTIITISLLMITMTLFSQKRIKMKRDGGVYTVPCIVNGLNLHFIFDTGANKVSISSAEATFMLKNGYLDSSDIVGTGKSKIADGSIIENTHIILRELEVAGMKFANIDALVVNNINAPLLLGQSVIQKLGKVQLDGDELVIFEQEKSLINERFEKTQQLLDEAFDYFERESDLRSYEKFLEAYNLGDEFFKFYDYGAFASVSRKIGEYEMTLRLLDKQNSMKEELNEEQWESLSYMYLHYYDVYSELNQNKKALLYLNKAISVRKSNVTVESTWGKLASCYNLRGYLYVKMEYWSLALESFKSAYSSWLNANTSKGDERDNFIENLRKDSIKNEWLGETFYQIGRCYQKLGNIDEQYRWMKASSYAGNNNAIRYIQKYFSK